MFPPVREKTDELIDDGLLIAAEEVLHELAKKDDDMYAWVKDREHMFIPIDEPIQLALQSMLPQHRK